MNMVHKNLLLCLIGILALTSLFGSAQSLPWDTPTTHYWYMRADTHTVNSQLGYVLNRTQTTTERVVSETYIYNIKTFFAARVYVRRSNNSTLELTDGFNTNISRSADGYGYQNFTFTPPNTVLFLGLDAVVVNLYIKFGTEAWIQKAVMISDHLDTILIQNSTWTFRLYTNKTYVGGLLHGHIYWGDSTHLSRIENIQVQTLKPWEQQLYYLRNQDFIQFILTPWLYYIGNLAYGIALLFVVVTTYLRYEDYKPLIPWLWIFGGTGGALTLLIPVAGLHLSWFILALALASTLYAIFR